MSWVMIMVPLFVLATAIAVVPLLVLSALEHRRITTGGVEAHPGLEVLKKPSARAGRAPGALENTRAPVDDVAA